MKNATAPATPATVKATDTIPAKQPSGLRLFKFGAPTCSACNAMDKAKTLEKFAEAHPDVEIVRMELNNAEGETPDGSEFAKNTKIADAYEVQALPTLLFVGKDGGILQAYEGGCNVKQLDKLYAHSKVMLETLSTAGVSK